ncbi:MAG: hypothetical protein AAGD43_03390 [Pseudomonadota bacterium]
MTIDWEHKSFQTLAIVIATGSAILTGYFGSNFGGGYWYFEVLLFVIFFAISLLCPLLITKMTSNALSWTLSGAARAVILLPLAAFFTFFDVVTNGGTSQFIRQNEMAISDNQNTKAKDARGEVTRLEDRITTIRATAAWRNVWTDPVSGKQYELNAPKAYDKPIEAAQLAYELEKKRIRCADLCEKRKKELSTLEAMKAAAVAREALKAELVGLERELKDAKVASAETPTRASAALAHASNLAAGLTRQIDPTAEAKFWANYGISALNGIAVTLANLAAAVLLAFSGRGFFSSTAKPAPRRRRRSLSDMRPQADNDTAAGQTAIYLQPSEQRRKDAMKALDNILTEIREEEAPAA